MAGFKTLWPAALTIVILGAVGWWVFWRYFDSYHLATVQPGVLYRDGVRSIGQFELAVKKTQVKTVVSLVDDREASMPLFVAEAEYCRGHGIDLVRLPVTLGGWPGGDEVKKFLEIVDDPARQPVMVHCAQGVRRTGMMVAAYQLSELKMTKEQSIAGILTFGHSDRTVGDVKRFIEVYDPVGRRMTEELPVGRE